MPSRSTPTPKRRQRAPDLEYNPQSFNAQFAGLHAKLKLHLDAIEKRFDGQDQSLEEIKIQTEKTNGRVTALEAKTVEITTQKRLSKAYVAGACAVLSFIFVTLGSLAVKFFAH